MWDSVLGIFGQSAEQAAQRDMDDYNPKTGSVGERKGLEVLGDYLRGGSTAVDQAARKEHLKNLQPYVDRITEISGSEPEVDYKSTKSKLLNQAREAQDSEIIRKEEEALSRIRERPETIEAKAKAQRQEDRVIRQDAESNRRFNTTQLAAIDARRDQTALGMAQLDITRQQEANRMAEETRRYDQRRADSKKERMAAIIAGLANLGGAFAI